MRWCCGASSIEPAGPQTLTAEQLAEKKKEVLGLGLELGLGY